MATHSELKKKLDSFPGNVTWSEGTPNATIAAAQNTFSNQRLGELERAATACGYEMTTNAGALVFVPKA